MRARPPPQVLQSRGPSRAPHAPLGWRCVWALEVFPPPSQAGRERAWLRETWQGAGSPGHVAGWVQACSWWVCLMTLLTLAVNPAGSDPLVMGSANAACGMSLSEPGHGACAKGLPPGAAAGPGPGPGELRSVWLVPSWLNINDPAPCELVCGGERGWGQPPGVTAHHDISSWQTRPGADLAMPAWPSRSRGAAQQWHDAVKESRGLKSGDASSWRPVLLQGHLSRQRGSPGQGPFIPGLDKALNGHQGPGTGPHCCDISNTSVAACCGEPCALPDPGAAAAPSLRSGL
ncbi:hypothetical protein KIL84_023460 [Mauremys mutica]|uniref:Uncharacterized protein n=1 Tax=Mauremys mutica TaxID=74926 RepID=A0A9D4ARJ5_9SAUR|nr:hypothetical protein KIL84_023460 [Mauremys mutica]